MNFNLLEGRDEDHDNEIIKYYQDNHTIMETQDHFNEKYGQSKWSIRKLLNNYNRMNKPSKIIESHGGIIFIKELVVKGYNLRRIAECLNINHKTLQKYCSNHGFKFLEDCPEYYNQSKKSVSDYDFTDAETIALGCGL